MDLGRIILLPNTLMWYLWVLIIYYFLFGILYHKRNNFDFIFIILLCISLLAACLYEAKMLKELCIKNLLLCAVFFYIGIHFKELIHITLHKSTVAVSIGIIVLNIIYMVITYLIKEHRSLIIDTFSMEINAFAMIITLAYVFQKIVALEKNSFLTFVEKNSLIIYLLHTYFVTAMRVVLLKLNVSNLFIIVVLCTVIPLVITIGISLLVPKIPFLQYIFKPILLVDKLEKKK